MDLSPIRKLSAEAREALERLVIHTAMEDAQVARDCEAPVKAALDELDRLQPAEARAKVTSLDLSRRRANVETLRSSARNASERWICDEFVRLFDTIEALNALLAEDRP